jgi:hypothetical protein
LTQDYAYAQKAEFVDKMKKELAEIQEELDRLSAKVERSSGEAKVDAKTRLDAVRGKWLLLTIGGEGCAAACERGLYATRQARTMQGKEQDRIVRSCCWPARRRRRPECWRSIPASSSCVRRTCMRFFPA